MSTQFKVNERYMTDKYRVNCAFSRVKYIRRTCKMTILVTFWSWFDINRPTVHDDIRKKRFLHFCYYVVKVIGNKIENEQK